MQAVFSIAVHTYFPLHAYFATSTLQCTFCLLNVPCPFNFAGKLQHGDYSKHGIVPSTQTCHRPDTVNDEPVHWDVTQYYKFAICLHV
jgi:hypothetical protein